MPSFRLHLKLIPESAIANPLIFCILRVSMPQVIEGPCSERASNLYPQDAVSTICAGQAPAGTTVHDVALSSAPPDTTGRGLRGARHGCNDCRVYLQSSGQHDLSQSAQALAQGPLRANTRKPDAPRCRSCDCSIEVGWQPQMQINPFARAIRLPFLTSCVTKCRQRLRPDLKKQRCRLKHLPCFMSSPEPSSIANTKRLLLNPELATLNDLP